MVDFRRGFREKLLRGIGVPTGIQIPEIDPTKVFPSVETSTGPLIHKSRGNFFQFNVSPTSFDLDPYFFFKKTVIQIIIFIMVSIL